ncbi:MAG: hypothetical protein M0D55_10555 [Elusimicrobiota bacterium]|nr:MAG: hypothetical protein M0D55_10555 [Elusimicrobiota bacterium]
MRALVLALFALIASPAATADRAPLDAFKSALDSAIAAEPLEPEAYLVRSRYYIRVKNWPLAAEDWLEGRRLWISKYHGALGMRAPDRAVDIIARVMGAADEVGLDPDYAATKALDTLILVGE